MPCHLNFSDGTLHVSCSLRSEVLGNDTLEKDFSKFCGLLIPTNSLDFAKGVICVPDMMFSKLHRQGVAEGRRIENISHTSHQVTAQTS